jgi:transaldolase
MEKARRISMKKNPLINPETFGQSVWLDFLRHNALYNGELQELIDQDGVSGLTSNPSIFEKAIAASHDYDNVICTLAPAGKSIEEIYQALTVLDIQRAADLFRPLYDRLKRRDGFVSLRSRDGISNGHSESVSALR